MAQLEQGPPPRVYSDAVYELYDPLLYTDQDIRHDLYRIRMLDELWDVAFWSMLLWRKEHPDYTGEEETAAQEHYFGLIFDAFWDIASAIKLWVDVRYYDRERNPYSKQAKGSMLKPDIAMDILCFTEAYRGVREIIEED